MKTRTCYETHKNCNGSECRHAVEIMTTKERSGPFVSRLRRLAKSYAAEGRGTLTIKNTASEKPVVICSGDFILESFPNKGEAQSHLRAGGFCQVSATDWRPRYVGAPWMAPLVVRSPEGLPYTV